MFKAWPITCTSIAVLLAGAMAVGAAAPQHEKSTGVVSPSPAAEKSEKERKLAAATETAKRLLLVMDTGKKRQGLQRGMDEVYGSRVRPIGYEA